jgi:hypothetical protein
MPPEAGDINPPLTTLVRLREMLGCKWQDLIGRVKVK